MQQIKKCVNISGSAVGDVRVNPDVETVGAAERLRGYEVGSKLKRFDSDEKSVHNLVSLLLKRSTKCSKQYPLFNNETTDKCGRLVAQPQTGRRVNRGLVC